MRKLFLYIYFSVDRNVQLSVGHNFSFSVMGFCFINFTFVNVSTKCPMKILCGNYFTSETYEALKKRVLGFFDCVQQDNLGS